MLHIFYLYDIVAKRNITICMESHNRKIETRTTRLERIMRIFNCCRKKYNTFIRMEMKSFKNFFTTNNNLVELFNNRLQFCG